MFEVWSLIDEIDVVGIKTDILYFFRPGHGQTGVKQKLGSDSTTEVVNNRFIRIIKI